MKKIVLTGENHREYLVSDIEANRISVLLDDPENRQLFIEIGSDKVKVSSIKGIYSAGADPRKDSYIEDEELLFSLNEREYKNQSVDEKADRQYYGLFLNLVVGAIGLKKVFGEDYHSPILDILFDSVVAWEKWRSEGFTAEQKKDRRNRFDDFVLRTGRGESWGKFLKTLWRDYFEKNTQSGWCPLGLWLPLLKDLPTSRLERLVLWHESRSGAVR